MKKIFNTLLLSASLLIAPGVFAEMVNINKATAAALQENLKGVGEKKSQAIVAYRKEFGAFKTLDEIMEVKGIGKGIFKKIKADLSLDEGVTELSAESKVKKKPVSNTVKPAAKDNTDKKADKADDATGKVKKS